MNAGREMPKYQCHKQVWALKIAAIEFTEDGSAKIAPADEGYAALEVGAGYRSKFHGGANYGDIPTDAAGTPDLGYYVAYADGYVSWSPTKAFEEGYTRI